MPSAPPFLFIKEEKTDETKDRSKRMWSNERQLTLETEYILRDIGMYVGETFRKNNLQIYWAYYTNPNRDFFVNHPLLMGVVDRTSGQPVNVVFEPIHMVGVQASKLLDRSSKPEDLYKLYCWWAEKNSKTKSGGQGVGSLVPSRGRKHPGQDESLAV